MSAINLDRVHLVGIGGAGMSGVARILLDRGSTVSGTDMKDSRAVRVLETAGAHIAIGHSADNLRLSGELPTVVVVSFAAIPQDNPELQAAREHGIAVIRRSDLLAELMDGYTQVLIAGTHGKTSTTSMTVAAMQSANLDPSFAIGGQLNKAGINAHHGTGSSFVAEADESDASLLRYQPNIAVVTNIEPDHLDFFENREAYFQVFDDFAAKLGKEGILVVCLDDDNAAALGARSLEAGISILGYGTVEAAQRHPEIPVGCLIRQYQPQALGSMIEVDLHVDHAAQPLETPVQGSYSLAIPGKHMVLNSVAALLSAVLAGGNARESARGLAEFSGVRRRFEFHGQISSGAFAGTRVYDDYAHHPTEVDAVLRAAREAVQAEGKGGRIISIFQPHLYSRTKEFAEEFAKAFESADVVVLLDIFGAREQPIDGVNSALIGSRIDAVTTTVIYHHDFASLPALIREQAAKNDLILTMGAGTVTVLADEIFLALQDA